MSERTTDGAMQLAYAALFLVALVLQTGCGGGNRSATLSDGSAQSIPQFAHVFVVLEENQNYADVIGGSSMPYLNGLAAANGLATQYFADAHPSLPNYFMLTAGEGESITGSAGDAFNGVVSQDNIVRALATAGKTWKCYAEGLPSVGYLGVDTGAYIQHHDPFVYFSDVQASASQTANVVPFNQLAADLASNSLPDYALIVPDVNNDSHDCPSGMSTCTDDDKRTGADNWLANNIDPLLKSSAFQNSLLVITFDEAQQSDVEHGGGQVATVIVSPQAKAGYQSTTFYQHESLLRLTMEGLRVGDLPGEAGGAPSMGEFFK